MEVKIKTNNLCRDFKSGGEMIQAIKKVTITIETGTLTVLKGKSGSGKTTLMNLMGALDIPTQGDVIFNGRSINDISCKERDRLRRVKFGFVYQSIALMSLMSAYENIEFLLRIAGFEKKLRKKRTEECLDLVGLKNRMHHLPNELSGGEQQRVAIARAIVHRPEVLFADEPTGELDTHLGLQIVKIFKNMTKDEGLTVIMATHDPNMMDIADHVYTLEDGVIIEQR